MRTTFAFPVLMLTIAGTPAVAAQGADASGRSVFPVRVVQGSEERIGTAIAVAREDRGPGTMVYFLTSSRLFTPFAGARPGVERSIRLLLEPDIQAGQVDIRPENLFVPEGNLVEVALFRAIVAHRDVAPQPLLYDPPPVGTAFVVAGFDHYGTRAAVAQHVRFRSTRQISGDRDASLLRGCVGAPALTPDGVFGVVTDCQPDRSPTIALLELARAFIDSHLPRPVTLTQRTTPEWPTTERSLEGLGVKVDCSTSERPAFEVPVQLRAGETVLSASGTLYTPREVPAGAAVILRTPDRTVRLRFAFGSDPKPPAPPAPCPTGQALATVRLRIVTVPEY